MIHWPFPGQEGNEHLQPPHNMPPPRFAVGDRISTRSGTATVMAIKDTEGLNGRTYHVRHDWVTDAPPGFGHFYDENSMQPHVDPPPEPDADDIEPRPAHQAAEPPQLELFA